MAAQSSSFYTDRAVGTFPVNGVQTLIPISYGQVRVCSLPTSGSPCNTPANGLIFDANSGSPLTVSGGNFGQLTTDVVGRFTFGCVPGNYQVQVAASSSNTPQLNYKVSCSFPAGTPPPNVTLGDVTALSFTGGSSNDPNNFGTTNITGFIGNALTVSGSSSLGNVSVGGALGVTGGGSLSGTFTGTPTFVGNAAGDSAPLTQPAVTALTAGTFNNIEAHSVIVGSGPGNGNPNTPLGWYQSLVPGGKGVEAGQFALSIPSGYTGPVGVANQVNALGSYLWTLDAGHYALAHSAFAVCDATGGICWGGNDVVTTYSGSPTHTGQQLHGREVDCEANTTGVTIICIQAGAPVSTTNPTSAIAFDVAKPAWPNGSWTAGLTIETGATVSGHGIQLSPLASGATQGSQDIQFQSTSAGSVTLLAGIAEDNGGNLVLTPGTGGFVRNSLAGSGWQLLSSGGNFTQITNTATGFRSIVFPDASGNVVLDTATQALSNKTTIGMTGQLTNTLATGTAPFAITSTTPVANLTTVPATYNAAGTQQTAEHLVVDTCTLGTNCGVTLVGAAVFTSSTSYTCNAQDQTAAAATRVQQTSGSAFTITGTGTDVIRYTCIGN